MMPVAPPAMTPPPTLFTVSVLLALMAMPFVPVASILPELRSIWTLPADIAKPASPFAWMMPLLSVSVRPGPPLAAKIAPPPAPFALIVPLLLVMLAIELLMAIPLAPVASIVPALVVRLRVFATTPVLTPVTVPVPLSSVAALLTSMPIEAPLMVPPVL